VGAVLKGGEGKAICLDLADKIQTSKPTLEEAAQLRATYGKLSQSQYWVMGLGIDSWNGERIKSGRESATAHKIPIFQLELTLYRVDASFDSFLVPRRKRVYLFLSPFHPAPPPLCNHFVSTSFREVFLGVRRMVICTKLKSTLDD
jgi:hypothetical protein